MTARTTPATLALHGPGALAESTGLCSPFFERWFSGELTACLGRNGALLMPWSGMLPLEDLRATKQWVAVPTAGTLVTVIADSSPTGNQRLLGLVHPEGADLLTPVVVTETLPEDAAAGLLVTLSLATSVGGPMSLPLAVPRDENVRRRFAAHHAPADAQRLPHAHAPGTPGPTDEEEDEWVEIEVEVDEDDDEPTPRSGSGSTKGRPGGDNGSKKAPYLD